MLPVHPAGVCFQFMILRYRHAEYQGAGSDEKGDADRYRRNTVKNRSACRNPSGHRAAGLCQFLVMEWLGLALHLPAVDFTHLKSIVLARVNHIEIIS